MMFDVSYFEQFNTILVGIYFLPLTLTTQSKANWPSVICETIAAWHVDVNNVLTSSLMLDTSI